MQRAEDAKVVGGSRFEREAQLNKLAFLQQVPRQSGVVTDDSFISLLYMPF